MRLSRHSERKRSALFGSPDGLLVRSWVSVVKICAFSQMSCIAASDVSKSHWAEDFCVSTRIVSFDLLSIV